MVGLLPRLFGSMDEKQEKSFSDFEKQNQKLDLGVQLKIETEVFLQDSLNLQVENDNNFKSVSSENETHWQQNQQPLAVCNLSQTLPHERQRQSLVCMLV